MTVPFYVSPEQIIKDKADYARKGIARGRSVIVMQYDDGIAFIAENPSRALHKISEIYDRIAFAAVGKYNEFENLRVAGVRLADLRGYSYARKDVTGRSLANAYAQTLGTIFTETPKPYEVEIVVAEVGRSAAEDELYRLTFDGSVADEHGFVAMGGEAEGIHALLARDWRENMPLSEAITVAVSALSTAEQTENGTPHRTVGPAQLEAAILDRHRARRTFRRLSVNQLADILGDQVPGPPTAGSADSPDE